MKSEPDKYSAPETEKRFRTVLRGALATKPISDEEIVRRSRAEKPKPKRTAPHRTAK